MPPECIGHSAHLPVDGRTQRDNARLLRLARRRGIGDPIADEYAAFRIPFVGIAHDLTIREPDHIADADFAAPSRVRAVDHDTGLIADIEHLIVVDGIIEGDIPSILRFLYRRDVELQLDSFIPDTTDVLDIHVIPRSRADRHFNDIVRGLFVVQCHVDTHPVTQEPGRQSELFFGDAYRTKIRIGQTPRGNIAQRLP